MLYTLSLSFSLIAGVMAIFLFYLGLNQKDKNRVRNSKPLRSDIIRLSSLRGSYDRNILIWAVLFLGASFGGLEWAFYLLGYNMFTFFAFPLVAYFAVWFAFIIWIFESRKERWLWVLFLIILIGLTIFANLCMNCVQIQ